MTKIVTAILDDDEVREIVEPILRRALEPYGFDHIEVESGEDHDGDPIVRVTVHYRQDAPEPTKKLARAALDAAVEASTALRERGEQRFAMVLHRYSGDEVLAEDGS